MERVAVVGLGNIATRHRRNLKQLFPNALLYAMSASGRVPQETVNDADLLVTSIEETHRSACSTRDHCIAGAIPCSACYPSNRGGHCRAD